MTTAAEVLDLARSQIGYVEERGNRTKYGAWYGMNGQPWCAMFTSWVLQHAGMQRDSMTHFAYTPYGYNAYRRAGRWQYKSASGKPQPGDLVFFGFMRSSSSRPHGISHLGFVESVESDGALLTIEGNTDAAGGRTGGRVMRKRRTTRIVGYGRPAYTTYTTAGTTPEQIEEDELAKLSEEAQEFLERQYRDLVKHDAAPTSQSHVLRFYRGVRENAGIEEPEALGRYVGHASNQGARLADMLAETGSSIRGLVTGAVQLIREHRKT